MSRIVFVSDAIHAMTSDRPYRKARSPQEARRVVLEEAGRRLDPRVVSAMFAALDAHVNRSADALRRTLLAIW